MKAIFRFLLVLLVSFEVFAQKGIDADASFLQARDIAFDGHWEIARDSLEHLLEVYPNYTDAKILIGKTYSWNGKYDEARKHFNRITSIEKEQKDAWLAAIKNEMYAKNLNTALGLANKALIHLKRDTEIQQLKNQLVEDLNKKLPIQDIMKEENREGNAKNQIAVSSDLEVFDIVFDPMYQTTIEYQRQTKYGKILPRITYAQRFNSIGTQFELDGYPTISKTFHGYFNFGYSNSVIFPKHRAGMELYAELPKAFEVSLGARHVSFNNINASILTGSLGMYRGNYYVSARPYVSARNDGQIGWAGTIMARKYGRDGNNFIGLRATYGFDAELNQFIVDGVLLSETQLFLETQQLQLEYQFSNLDSINMYTVNAGVRRQEFMFDSGNFFWAVSAGLKYQFRF
ncbi:MAG: YaiO family outer membrane beta-barrel protein [Bacteroidota bacterium]